MPKIPQNVKKWVRKEKTQDLENKTRLTAKIKRKNKMNMFKEQKGY